MLWWVCLILWAGMALAQPPCNSFTCPTGQLCYNTLNSGGTGHNCSVPCRSGGTALSCYFGTCSTGCVCPTARTGANCEILNYCFVGGPFFICQGTGSCVFNGTVNSANEYMCTSCSIPGTFGPSCSLTHPSQTQPLVFLMRYATTFLRYNPLAQLCQMPGIHCPGPSNAIVALNFGYYTWQPLTSLSVLAWTNMTDLSSFTIDMSAFPAATASDMHSYLASSLSGFPALQQLGLIQALPTTSNTLAGTLDLSTVLSGTKITSLTLRNLGITGLILPASLANFTSLEISGCHNLTTITNLNLTQARTTLQSFIFNDLPALVPARSDWSYFFAGGSFPTMPSLTTFNVSSFGWTWPSGTIFSSLAQFAPALQTLDLTGTKPTDGLSASGLLSSLALQTVALRDLSLVGPFPALPFASNLTFLDLRNVTLTGVIPVTLNSSNYPHLTTLFLASPRADYFCPVPYYGWVATNDYLSLSTVCNSSCGDTALSSPCLGLYYHYFSGPLPFALAVYNDARGTPIDLCPIECLAGKPIIACAVTSLITPVPLNECMWIWNTGPVTAPCPWPIGQPWTDAEIGFYIWGTFRSFRLIYISPLDYYGTAGGNCLLTKDLCVIQGTRCDTCLVNAHHCASDFTASCSILGCACIAGYTGVYCANTVSEWALLTWSNIPTSMITPDFGLCNYAAAAAAGSFSGVSYHALQVIPFNITCDASEPVVFSWAPLPAYAINGWFEVPPGAFQQLLSITIDLTSCASQCQPATTFPDSWQNLTALRTFYLIQGHVRNVLLPISTMIMAEIPGWLVSMPRLQSFTFISTVANSPTVLNLTEVILPPTLTQLTLMNIHLVGQLPDNANLHPDLNIVIQGCTTESSIPDDYATAMGSINLQGSSFTGTVPCTFANLSSLNFNGNSFTGFLPLNMFDTLLSSSLSLTPNSTTAFTFQVNPNMRLPASAGSWAPYSQLYCPLAPAAYLSQVATSPALTPLLTYALACVANCPTNTCPSGFTCRIDGTCLPNSEAVVTAACALCSGSTNPCLNGAPCTANGTQVICHCLTNYTGALCEIDNDMCTHVPGICKNGATCTSIPGSVDCTCPSVNFNGTFCQNNFTGCIGNTACLNGGTCVPVSDGSFVCDCTHVNFTGSVCTEPYSACRVDPCLNSGVCASTNVNGTTRNCTCPLHVSGTNCEVDLRGCDSSPCLNGGTCTAVNGGTFTCACPDQYNGTTCQEDFTGCNSVPCANNATCIPLSNGTVICECAPFFGGSTCAFPEAHCGNSDPCINGGTCIDLASGANCACPPLFAGTTCENNLSGCSKVSSTYCNYGTCVPLNNGTASCQCPGGVTGQFCQTDSRVYRPSFCSSANVTVDCSPMGYYGVFTCPTCTASNSSITNPTNSTMCAGSPCLNGGTCLSILRDTAAHCVCPPGWTGFVCEQADLAQYYLTLYLLGLANATNTTASGLQPFVYRGLVDPHAQICQQQSIPGVTIQCNLFGVVSVSISAAAFASQLGVSEGIIQETFPLDLSYATNLTSITLVDIGTLSLVCTLSTAPSGLQIVSLTGGTGISPIQLDIPCAFPGSNVSTFTSGSFPNLVELTITSATMQGTLNFPRPASIANFRRLNLSHNSITGTIPAEIFSHNLTFINLSNNLLTGTIPTTFASNSLGAFWQLSLDNNMLVGTIPLVPVGFLLEKLTVTNNFLRGNILQAFDTLSSTSCVAGFFNGNLWTCLNTFNNLTNFCGGNNDYALYNASCAYAVGLIASCGAGATLIATRDNNTCVMTCDAGNCLNGGSCQFNATGYEHCQCPQGFGGVFCEAPIDTCTPYNCTNAPATVTCTASMSYVFLCGCQNVNATGGACLDSGICFSGKCANGGTCVTYNATLSYCHCASGFYGAFCNMTNACEEPLVVYSYGLVSSATGVPYAPLSSRLPLCNQYTDQITIFEQPRILCPSTTPTLIVLYGAPLGAPMAIERYPMNLFPTCSYKLELHGINFNNPWRNMTLLNAITQLIIFDSAFGQLPTSFTAAPNLVVFAAGRTAMTGTISPTIASSRTMEAFEVLPSPGGTLTGTFPNQIIYDFLNNTFGGLGIISLYGNRLAGAFPTAINNVTITYTIRGNLFDCPWPVLQPPLIVIPGFWDYPTWVAEGGCNACNAVTLGPNEACSPMPVTDPITGLVNNTALIHPHCYLNASVCQHGGTCYFDSITGIETCGCTPAYYGEFCQGRFAQCVDLPCQNGGTCVQNTYNYTCECPSWMTGQNCTVPVNPCLSVQCQNNGTCNDLGSGNWSCTCPSFFNGTLCQNNYAGCSSSINPCLNNGTCIPVLGGGFSCACPQNITGSTCATIQGTCNSTVCQNGGTCFPVPNSFACACQQGYLGATCSQNFTGCLQYPIVFNGGTCVPLSGGAATFDCPTGFSGIQCAQDNTGCDTTPCQNGGTCFPGTTGDYTCECPSDFIGLVCNVAYPCGSSPCQNGGTCNTIVSVPLSFNCSCMAGFTGPLCQDAPVTTTTTTTHTTTTGTPTTTQTTTTGAPTSTHTTTTGAPTSTVTTTTGAPTSTHSTTTGASTTTHTTTTGTTTSTSSTSSSSTSHATTTTGTRSTTATRSTTSASTSPTSSTTSTPTPTTTVSPTKLNEDQTARTVGVAAAVIVVVVVVTIVAIIVQFLGAGVFL